jgi:hypothetical protein
LKLKYNEAKTKFGLQLGKLAENDTKLTEPQTIAHDNLTKKMYKTGKSIEIIEALLDQKDKKQKDKKPSIESVKDTASKYPGAPHLHSPCGAAEWCHQAVMEHIGVMNL